MEQPGKIIRNIVKTRYVSTSLPFYLCQLLHKKTKTTTKPITTTNQIEWFSYDLEMKTPEQNRNNKRTEIEPFHWFIERIYTNARGFWLVKGTLGWNNVMHENFLEISLFFVLTSYFTDLDFQDYWPVKFGYILNILHILQNLRTKRKFES